MDDGFCREPIRYTAKAVRSRWVSQQYSLPMGGLVGHELHALQVPLLQSSASGLRHPDHPPGLLQGRHVPGDEPESCPTSVHGLHAGPVAVG